MDAHERVEGRLKKIEVETKRPPLLPSEKVNNGITHRSKTREVGSRYKSPSHSTPSCVRRCASPNIERSTPSSTVLAPKRAQSAERRRPSTPPSPTRPTTPVNESAAESQLLSRRTIGSRTAEALWPSTMRSLSVSFQSDTISIPVSKKEKPAPFMLADRTLRPSSNVGPRQVETPTQRKATPERKRSPLKGKNAPEQSENSKPVDGLNNRMIDQHRWPSRTGGKVSSNSLARSIDLMDRTTRTPSIPFSGIPLSSIRRLSLDGVGRPLQKSASDAASQLSLNESGTVEPNINSSDDTLLVSGLQKSRPLSSSERTTSVNPSVTFQSLPTPGSRPASPGSRLPSASKTLSSVSKGVSPARTRSTTPIPSRGTSPSRVRPSSSSGQSSSSTSVLSFIVDYRKGKKGNLLEDAHQLRLLYNTYLQWRFANARQEIAMYIQKVTAELALCNVCTATCELLNSVTTKRIEVQQLKLELKLNCILNGQMAYLNDWALLERDHSISLSQAIEDLEASTLRLPVVGVRADIETLKQAVSSAVDVMQAMGSSICSLLSRVEAMNSLVSEVAEAAAQERAMLDECEARLASTAALQVEEYSLRTQLIQLKQALKNGEQPIYAV
ncbi:QWRF family [Dillenia turbinata]|uniref:QWRF family n=1 Tax=Dillenia turbinata TaxID=194707 RepID=A0AAN8VXR4_9MAGN